MSNNLTFSGHDSFECRQFWLKKGFDHLNAGRKFDDEAVVHLGVGRNMVTAIRYWMRAFGLTDEDGKLNEFAYTLFDDNKGLDPYLEDEATLWLLHYNLVTLQEASIYQIIFNELRRKTPEFSKDQLLTFITSKRTNQNQNTLNKDFEVFTQTYISKSNDAEEGYDGLLTDLQLVQELKTKGSKYYVIEYTDRKNLPLNVLFYIILITTTGNSLDLETLYYAIGPIFAIHPDAFASKVIEISNAYKKQDVVYNNNSGVFELQFKKSRPLPEAVLKNAYLVSYEK